MRKKAGKECEADGERIACEFPWDTNCTMKMSCRNGASSWVSRSQTKSHGNLDWNVDQSPIVYPNQVMESRLFCNVFCESGMSGMASAYVSCIAGTAMIVGCFRCRSLEDQRRQLHQPQVFVSCTP